MAIKQKEEIQQSKLKYILTKEYKWENLLLGLLAIVAMVLSVMILTGNLTIDPTFPVLGTSPGDKIFASVLLGVSLFGLVLVLYPFFAPAWPEMKKISWPKWKVFLENALKVLFFTAFLTLVLYFFDMAVIGLFQRIQG
ncbi:preprotein translocase subunit SecE [Acholeplasma sp. OttesenSCG-928-E16]|nr:preprotein translocase subunit SecE [Acholeplasma sp. OttesenSCG-928-E16]